MHQTAIDRYHRKEEGNQQIPKAPVARGLLHGKTGKHSARRQIADRRSSIGFGRLSDKGQHRQESQQNDHAGQTEIGFAPTECSYQGVADHRYDDCPHSNPGQHDAQSETTLTVEPGRNDFRIRTRRLTDRHQTRQREHRVEGEHRARQQRQCRRRKGEEDEGYGEWGPYAKGIDQGAKKRRCDSRHNAGYSGGGGDVPATEAKLLRDWFDKGASCENVDRPLARNESQRGGRDDRPSLAVHFSSLVRPRSWWLRLVDAANAATIEFAAAPPHAPCGGSRRSHSCSCRLSCYSSRRRERAR